MRVVLSLIALLTALGANVVHAQDTATLQSGTETPEEIVVRGTRLADFRVEVERARVRAYDIFNEVNSSDDFDIECVEEPRSGSRMGRRVCAARFEGRISANASKDYLGMMRAICPDAEGLTQRCLFDPGLASRGMAVARSAENEALTQRDRLEAEIQRLARTDLRFGQAILDFYDASVKYEEERKRSRERKRER